MENKLYRLFDFQKFQGNQRMASLISQAEQEFSQALDDESLSWVAAAGDLQALPKKEDWSHEP